MIKVFAVFDLKAGAYMMPFTMPATGQALRAFSDSVNDPKTGFYRHPGDYELFLIGEFDEISGQLSGKVNPEYLVRALDVKEEVDRSQLKLAFGDEDSNGATPNE